MVYADGSNPSVRKDIGVRLPFPARQFASLPPLARSLRLASRASAAEFVVARNGEACLLPPPHSAAPLRRRSVFVSHDPRRRGAWRDEEAQTAFPSVPTMNAAAKRPGRASERSSEAETRVRRPSKRRLVGGPGAFWWAGDAGR